MAATSVPPSSWRKNLVRRYREFALIARDPVLLIGLMIAGIFIAVLVFLPISKVVGRGFVDDSGAFSLKFFADRKSALLSAFTYLSFLGVYLLGTHATLDALLTLFLTTGIMSYVLATLEPHSGRAWLYWILCGLSLGLAFLTKGFLAFAVPVIVLVPWLLWRHHWKALLLKGWLVILIAILTALPWALLIHQQESDFWNYFFWVEHIERFTAKDAQHQEPFYYFIIYLPLLAFPWFSLLPAALSGLKNSPQQGTPGINQLLWLWLLLPFIFFSMSSGKLATYILPCFPPLAILISQGLYRYFQEKGSYRLFKWGTAINTLVMMLLLIIIVFFQLKNDSRSPFESNESFQLSVLVFSIILALISGWLIIRKTGGAKKMVLTFGFLLPVIAFMTVSTPYKIIAKKAPSQLILEAAPLIDNKTIVISAGSMFRAVNWYLKRQDVYLLTKNEVEYGLNYPDSSYRFMTATTLKQMIQEKSEHPVAIFCHRDCPDYLLKMLPADVTLKTFGSFEFRLIR